MNEIKINTAEKELYYKEQVIVRYSIQYPEIIKTQYKIGAQKFNNESRKNALKLKQFIEEEFYNEAKQNYEYNQKNIHQLISECNILYNCKNVIIICHNETTSVEGKKSVTINKIQTYIL